MKSAIWISSVQNVSPLVRAILLLRTPAQVITSFARAIELECRPICKCICALVFHKMRVDSCFRSDAEAFWRRLLCSESGRYEWACFYGLWGPRHPPHWLREGTFCASVYLLFWRIDAHVKQKLIQTCHCNILLNKHSTYSRIVIFWRGIILFHWRIWNATSNLKTKAYYIF